MRLAQQPRIVIVKKLLRVAEQAFQFREMRRGLEFVLKEEGASGQAPVHMTALIASIHRARGYFHGDCDGMKGASLW